MKRILIIAVLLCHALSGCSWMDGSYHYVAPHDVSAESDNDSIVTAGNFGEIRAALEKMVVSGKEAGLIYIKNTDQAAFSSEMERARTYIMTTFPYGAYAVEDLTFEVGTSGGVPAASVEITYLRSRSEIQRIGTVKNMAEVLDLVDQALDEMSTGIVIMVEQYAQQDFARHIQEYAELHPERIMEIPQISEGTYPSNSSRRILELKFTYQSTAETLRQMRSQVKPVFDAAKLYVSADGNDTQKYTQLFAFLMERYEYKISTSLTPAYSLLRHGVGDSKTFALVYAAMCRSVGLDCEVVTGTRDGEPWYWNIICTDGNYSHLDLLLSSENNEFMPMSDDRMIGYVWDYSGYPACPATESEELPEETEETQAAEN